MTSILVVCTGNICRSPMAEGFLRSILEARGLGEISVSSAGVAGWEGSPATPEAVEAAAEWGSDISGHAGRRLDTAMLEEADLVLAMAMEHASSIERLVLTASAHTFTLKELVKLLDQLPPRPAGADDPLAAAIEAADALRHSGGAEMNSDLDVADPLGLGLQAFRATAWEIHELCVSLVNGVFGPAGADAGGSEVREEGGVPG